MSFLRAASNNPYPRQNNNRKVQRVAPHKKDVVSIPNVDVVHLQRTVKNDTEVLAKFMSFEWPKQSFHPTFDEKTNISINGFTEMDSGQKQHLIVYDNQSQNFCLFAKISREKVLRKLGGRNPAKRLRLFSSEMCRCMRNIPRGQQRGSVDNGYFIVGERANRSAPGIGGYKKCKPNIKEKDFKSLQCLACDIVKGMEEALWPLTRHLHLEESVAHQVRKGRNLDTFGIYATAMSMGITYQSMCHTDKDFYYSLLTVAAPSHRYDKSIIYWFVFPSYNVKVALRSGDVVLFNPMIPHCCSNPLIEGSTILSSYSSQTTLFRSESGSDV
eukprot:CAMPEP_0201136286 /NCGR_PEP_ID=MMETSP0850-20130426/54804_1 /ASSEMBLY_ACC=CAM_ASM_000622 /TAXON_ID=183588 /ORGANISM="Pseudo-nitzschia fraudulenta, Strain WWA7" /LENGTH=327 /DNA_ID=CAMNT_0047407577 /DNA_START=5 /DNA_END=988 /DNA_ORIENTATION=+